MLASGETRGIVPQKTSSLRRGAVINASNFRIAGQPPGTEFHKRAVSITLGLFPLWRPESLLPN